MSTSDLMDKSKSELQEMAEELGLATSGNKEELAERIDEALASAEDPAADAEVESATGPTGPTMSPVEEPQPVEETMLAPSQPEEEPDPDAEGVAGGNVAEDGVVDIDLGPPVVGQWVKIVGGEYAGRYAAYLGNVGTVSPKEGTPGKDEVPLIQVRTRDADNLLVDVLYSDVESTTYSGGR